MTGPSATRLFDGPQNVPVFTAAEAVCVGQQSLLRAYRGITTAQVAGLLAAVAEYGARVSATAPLHTFFTGATPTGDVVARHADLFGPIVRRSYRCTRLREPHPALAAAGLDGRPVFDTAGQRDIALFKYTRGHEDLTVGELCLLLERLERYLQCAIPITPLAPLSIEGIARAVHAHNRLLTFRDRPFTLDEFARTSREVVVQARPLPSLYTSNITHPAAADPAAPRAPEVPDYLEPLLAWRVWFVLPQEREPGAAPTPRLVSLFSRTVWTPYAGMVAQHTMGTRCLPGAPCRCGIYAFRTAERARQEMRLFAPRFASCAWVAGQVWLWGHFAEHQHGWRAQHAYPARIVYGRGCDPAAVAAAYGIPYEEDESWTSVLRSGEVSPNRFDFPSPSLPRLPSNGPPPLPNPRPPNRRPRRRSIFVADRPVTIAFLSCYRIYRPVPRCCDAVREVCLAAADAVRRLAQFGPLAHVGALAQLGPHLARRYADVLRRRKV